MFTHLLVLILGAMLGAVIGNRAGLAIGGPRWMSTRTYQDGITGYLDSFIGGWIGAMVGVVLASVIFYSAASTRKIALKL